MASSLQLLSLLLSRTRASALCSRATFALTPSRFISKGPNIQPWARHKERAPRHSDEISDGESEFEDVEDKIQNVINKEVKRRNTVKYHILRRQMTPRGPPERKLTWDAMQEIRHLKQEQPEEWTVERLAEGFSVSKDTILRVLRSKFAPSSERQAKQDMKVMAKHKQQVLIPGLRVEPEKLRLTSSTRAALSAGSGNSALIPMGGQSLIPQTEQNPGALSAVTKHQFSEITKRSTEMPQEEIQHSAERTVVEQDVEEEDEDDGWDGQVLSEEDIELMTVKATPVVKEGNEFFDVDGNFLFKI